MIIITSLSMIDNSKINYFNRIVVLRYVHKSSHFQNVNTFKNYVIDFRRINSLIKNIDNKFIDVFTANQNRSRVSRVITFTIIKFKKIDTQNKIKKIYLTRFSNHIQKKIKTKNLCVKCLKSNHL